MSVRTSARSSLAQPGRTERSLLRAEEAEMDTNRTMMSGPERATVGRREGGVVAQSPIDQILAGPFACREFCSTPVRDGRSSRSSVSRGSRRAGRTSSLGTSTCWLARPRTESRRRCWTRTKIRATSTSRNTNTTAATYQTRTLNGGKNLAGCSTNRSESLKSISRRDSNKPRRTTHSSARRWD